jgi:hypothetical protein
VDNLIADRMYLTSQSLSQLKVVKEESTLVEKLFKNLINELRNKLAIQFLVNFKMKI